MIYKKQRERVWEKSKQGWCWCCCCWWWLIAFCWFVLLCYWLIMVVGRCLYQFSIDCEQCKFDELYWLGSSWGIDFEDVNEKARDRIDLSQLGMALIAAWGARVWRRLLDVDTFVDSPQVELVGVRITRDFKLSVNRSTISVASDVQVSLGRFVSESYRLIPLPVFFVAVNDPVVAVVTFTVLAKCAHFLVVGEWRLKQVAVEIASSGQVEQANYFAAFDGITWSNIWKSQPSVAISLSNRR